MKEVGKTLTWSLETGWWWWANVECGGGPGQRLAWTHFATDPRQWWVVGAWWSGRGMVTYYFIMLNTNCPIIAQYSNH